MMRTLVTAFERAESVAADGLDKFARHTVYPRRKFLADVVVETDQELGLLRI